MNVIRWLLGGLMLCFSGLVIASNWVLLFRAMRKRKHESTVPLVGDFSARLLYLCDLSPDALAIGGFLFLSIISAYSRF